MANPVADQARALADKMSGGSGAGGDSEIRERLATLEANYTMISKQLDDISGKLDRIGTDVAETKGELRGKPGHMQIFGIVTFAIALLAFAVRYGAQYVPTLP